MAFPARTRGAGPEQESRACPHAPTEVPGKRRQSLAVEGKPALEPTDPCAPAGLCSYFLSTEDLPRRRQLYRYVGTDPGGPRLGRRAPGEAPGKPLTGQPCNVQRP